MARIMIIAEPSELFEFIGHALSQENHRVRFLHDLRTVVTRITSQLPDVIILDGESSLYNSHELCEKLRRRHRLERSRIMIIRPASGSDTVGGRSPGPDMYVERPLHPRTLLARVHELVAHKALEPPRAQIVFGDFVIDPISFQASRSGRLLDLTFCEFRLMHHFASHPNELCRRDELLRIVWDNPHITPRCVDVCVRHLRMKIEEDPKKPCLIRTAHGQGYYFRHPPKHAVPFSLQGSAERALDSNAIPVTRY